MSTLRVGIAGAGWVGAHHLTAWKRVRDAALSPSAIPIPRLRSRWQDVWRRAREQNAFHLFQRRRVPLKT
jgi:hypothetical protein